MSQLSVQLVLPGWVREQMDDGPVGCTRVLIFCFEFQELPYLTLDFAQAGKKKLLLQAEATDKMTSIFSQNDNFNHFVHLLSFLTTFIFFSA